MTGPSSPATLSRADVELVSAADSALRAAIRPMVVDEGPDLPPAPHEERLLDVIMFAALPVLREAVASAYQAGIASCKPKPKPPPVYVKPRGNCAVCGVQLTLNIAGDVRGHDVPRKKGERFLGFCLGSRKPPRAVA